MTLLLDRTLLAARRRAAAGPLAPLAASLRRDLEPLIASAPEIPREKAMLSRDGGRCARDGSMLDFDPYDGLHHRCPACNAVYEGDRHHRWWVMWRHLWLAERAVHGALLHALTGDRAAGELARTLVEGYGDAYLRYPNRDNVLGPARPFFSTYLESIWLLQLCIALDLLEAGGARVDGAAVRERLLEPSAALIASFDEGDSNRQVWNNAALIAAARLLDREALARRAIGGPSGLEAHLEMGLLADGSWYEGENYHLFAHRGLWYGVTMAQRMGVSLPHDLTARFAEGFAAPLATALPDFTFPARRDAQYGISLRQWRFAESCELGLARGDDSRLRGALWELYERSGIPRRDTGRARSTADAERNEPPTALGRADLGWRALLCALPELPPLEPLPPRSAHLAEQGIAVFRRDAGRAYVALDYGHTGGGHGHPDRLNLLLVHGERRLLDDMGTGSYVDPSLHWYRSTLAHNAPLAGGHSQQPIAGVLAAYDERGGAGWVSADLPEGALAPAARARRSVVVMPDYLVDRVTFAAFRSTTFDVPVHRDGELRGVSGWSTAVPDGGGTPTDGFAFLRDTARAHATAGSLVRLESDGGAAWFLASEDAEWWRATAPGAPGHGDARFHFARLRGREAALTTVWDWSGAVETVCARDGVLVVQLRDGSRHEHVERGAAWHIDLFSGGARSSIDLAGPRPRARRETPPPPLSAIVASPLPTLGTADVWGSPLRFALGEREYRRSEESWVEAGSPRAEVAIAMGEDGLEVGVRVHKRPLCLRAPDAADPALDNEHPDIHSDGVQLYLTADGWPQPAAWLAVPEENGGVRVRQVDGSRAGLPLRARWHRMDDGYEMRFAIPRDAIGISPGETLALDVIVNDMGAGRERRRGQLVLSGGAGEFIYLRGDRQPTARFLRFRAPGG